MTISRFQALLLALGLMLVGIAAARAEGLMMGPSGPMPSVIRACIGPTSCSEVRGPTAGAAGRDQVLLNSRISLTMY